MKKYVFKPYSELFPELFQREKERILYKLNEVLAIEHIGSTAVPGLGGKGIIDIAIAVNKANMDSISKKLQDLGYEFRPTFSSTDRFYFIIYLPDPEEISRRYHLHLTYPENNEWKEFIGFRDYLRGHPKELQEYAELKKQAALEANQEGDQYRKVKQPIFEKIRSLTKNYNIDLKFGIETSLKSEIKSLLLDKYKQLLNFKNATFSLIDHEDAMVAMVYKITKSNGEQFILKISERPNDYFREVFFLQQLVNKSPVPKIIQLIEPSKEIDGAILMEYLPGELLKEEQLSESLAYEIGQCLAMIHLYRLSGYGDPIQKNLSTDPRTYFTLKFEEGLEECQSHLPNNLIKKCSDYYQANLHLLSSVDGPCIAHRDFRPGNIIIHEGKLKGIIDWAGARASFAEEDLCALKHGEWSNHSTSIKSILAGYGSVRPIPNYMRLALFLRLNKAIATIGFTVKSGTWNNTGSCIYQYNCQFLEQLLEVPR